VPERYKTCVKRGIYVDFFSEITKKPPFSFLSNGFTYSVPESLDFRRFNASRKAHKEPQKNYRVLPDYVNNSHLIWFLNHPDLLCGSCGLCGAIVLLRREV
jgi:hypothetical protein